MEKAKEKATKAETGTESEEISINCGFLRSLNVHGKMKAINNLSDIVWVANEMRDDGWKEIDSISLSRVIQACLLEIDELSDV